MVNPNIQSLQGIYNTLVAQQNQQKQNQQKQKKKGRYITVKKVSYLTFNLLLFHSKENRSSFQLKKKFSLP